ncbi:hypothetical protein HEK616_40610 [Streptomyces nigrescens]|uniref:Uncharacterized protein n=1 Tax=Streptomyces nigrescens TaxID=1920 RepID=A0ABM7ZW32_STRNI|nr:hypothetical protein [Streptomyces nigrescens]BDM70574.1 hypothetical protein HEK616_40610 [Streptomyces nigrescens]
MNVEQIAAAAASDGEHRSPEFWSDPVWVRVDNFDMSYDLYRVSGFASNTCQPTLTLEHVERVLP